MKRTRVLVVGGFVVVAVISVLLACSASVAPSGGGGIAVDFTIGGRTFTIDIFDNVGAFDVQANAAPARKAMIVQLFDQTPSDAPESIDLFVDAADVQVIPLDTGTQKAMVAAADGAGPGTVDVKVYLSFGSSENPCEEGNPVMDLQLRYENGETVVYRNGQREDVRAAFGLLGNKASLVRNGLFSLCLAVSSDDMTSQVIINKLGVQVHAPPSALDDLLGDDDDDDDGSGEPDPGQIVTFNDPCLEDQVRTSIGKATGDITAGDLSALTSLELTQSGLSDLTGLEYCGYLDYLNLSHNDIVDLEPLRGLRRLRHLDLTNNLIQDVEPLSTLASLEILLLTANQISNLEPLRGLSGLTLLNVSYQQDRRIPGDVDTQLADGFNYSDHTVLSEISVVEAMPALTELSASGNQISDLWPLSQLDNLYRLVIAHNKIVDVTPLRELPALRSVILSNNPVGDLRPFVDNLDFATGASLTCNCCQPEFYCIATIEGVTDTSQCDYIDQLKDRGATVNSSFKTTTDSEGNVVPDFVECAKMPPILGLGTGTCEVE